MAGKTYAFSLLVQELFFQAVTSSTLASSAGSASTTYVSLHTADPGPGGSQSTSEAAYTSYARQSVARSSGGWSVSGGSVSDAVISPAATISFPTATGGSETETYMGIGLSSSGAGTLLYSGAITPNIVVATGVTPQITTSTTITES